MKKNKALTYEIIIKTHIYKDNPNAQCGLARTFEISVQNQDHIIFDKIRFEEECGLYSYLNDLIVVPHEGYAFVNGIRNAKQIGSYAAFTKDFFFADHVFPVKNIDIYKN